VQLRAGIASFKFYYILKMRIFSKILPLALALAVLAPNAYATNIYDRDFVRGFISLKGDYRLMNSKGQEFLNRASGMIVMAEDGTEPWTGKSYAKDYVTGHVEIGAKYHSLKTWFDIEFMPLSLTRTYTLLDEVGKPLTNATGDTLQSTSRWYNYGITWMWGYELFWQTAPINLIPSMGFGFEFLNVRSSYYDRVLSCMGPSLNLELELRAQIYQFSLGVYGGYKVVRMDGWDALSQSFGAQYPFSSPYRSDVNFDKVFMGVKLSWTMLSEVQKRLRDLE
jgi:hypothetical protein